MVTCSIIRDPETKEISRVLAPNGQDSQLFKSITGTVTDKEEAIKVWAYAYTDSFKQRFGDWEKLARVNLTDPGMDDITLENLALQFDEKLDDNGEPLLQEVEKIAEEAVGDPVAEVFRSLISDKTTFGQPREIEPIVYDDQKVQYTLKAIKVVSDNMSQIQSWERNKSISPELLFNKIMQLGVPRNQLALLMDQPGETVEEKLASFAGTYSYAVEINISTQETYNNSNFDLGKFRYYTVVGRSPGEGEEAPLIYMKGLLSKTKEGSTQKLTRQYEELMSRMGIPLETQRRSNGEYNYRGDEITRDEYVKAYERRYKEPYGTAITKNTIYHSDLTVPGGTNYTENEIATPDITSAIKGHAQFATDRGIGWFRSDDKAPIVEGFTENKEAPAERGREDAVFKEEPKTRRILEVQSDLFQKGRQLEELSKVPVSAELIIKLKKIGVGIGQKFNVKGTWFEVIDKKPQGARMAYLVRNMTDSTKTSWMTNDAIVKAVEDYYETKTSSNAFLQLLNKDNKWVTFFVKSIIQDSAKKGYEKVLFPSGNTASKVEGHSTLEEFKKQKEDRIKKLEDYKKRSITKSVFGNYEVRRFNFDKPDAVFQTRKEAEEFWNSKFSKAIDGEINQLKQELERVGREGFGALKPIYNFYDNNLTNVLRKQGYNPKQVTDEYGNTWNEVELKPLTATESIMLQTEETAAAEPSDAELNNRVTRFLEKIGVSVQSVDVIRDAAGNRLSATAKADMLNRIIQVVDGKEQIDTLPEEAAHFFVEMLGPGNPLYKEMFSKITNYKIYASTVDNYKNLKAYRNLDGTVNFDKIKKEAIGKLIAEHIIRLNLGDETNARVADALTWWQKVWKFITDLFARADENPFETAAEQILDGDISALDVNAVVDGEFYQYADPVSNLESDQDRITLDDSVDPRTGQKRHIYYYNGNPAKGSVTGVYVDRFLKRIFRSDERTDRQRVTDLVKADFGDIIHLEMRKIVDSWLTPDGTKAAVQMPIKTQLPPAMYKMLNDYVQSLMKQYPAGTMYKTEVKIFDQKANIGGSIDLLVIKPDGEVDIYDWKSTEVRKDQTDLKEYKESVFKIQLDEYRKILAKQYGFTKFGTIRAIPIRTQFNYSKGEIQSLKSLEIGSIDPTQIPDEKSYLLPVLLRNEPTGNKQLDALIERINGIYEKIKSKKATLGEINQKREELKNLRMVLRDLQLRKRVDKLIELGMIEFKKYSDKIEKNTLTGKDIQEGIKILEVFSDSGVMLYELMEQYAANVEKSDDKKAKSEYNKINRQFLQMTSKVSNLIMQMKEYQKEQAIQLAEEKGITSLLDPESPVGTVQGLFQALSNIKQKGFRVFSNLLRRAQGIRDNRIKVTFDKLKTLKEDFVKWASQKGMSPNKAMEMILEIDSKGNWNGNFLEKYDPEFKRLKKDAINRGDLKWLQANLQFDPESKFEAALARQKEYFNSIIYASDEEVNKKIVEEKIEEWVEQHNIFDKRGQLNMTALLNPRNIFLKPTDNWLSNKWQELYKKDAAGNLINKPLVDMYEYFQELTRKAEDLGMLDRYSPKFIPSIHAGKIENLVFGDLSSFVSAGKFFDDLEVDNGTRYSPQIDPTDGSIVNRIPVYFTNDMGVEKTDSAGNTVMDYSSKSRDLFKVFAIWANHVYNYEAMSSIEDDAINLLEVERQKKSLVTDTFNNPVIENGRVKAANNNDRNAKLLEEFMNFYLYDRTAGVVTDVKVKVPFTNKEYSLLKGVNAAMSYFSLKTLGLNLTSASAQFVGGTGNALFTAQKGIFFTKNTWAKSMYYTSSSKKAMAALGYLNILQDGGARTLVDTLSLSAPNRVLSADNAFFMQRFADKTVQYPVAIALMLEHMVDPATGNIVSIQSYVKNKYDYNNKYYSLPAAEREKMKRDIDKEVGELQDTKSLFAIGKVNKDGTFEIEGIDPESDTLLAFRDKIKGINKRIIGNQTRDDVNGIRTTLLGSALMQFRNWIPEMVEERVSGLKYDDELQTWVYGKFNVFFGDLISRRFPKLLKALVSGFGHDAIELAKMRYEELRAEAIEKGEEFTITEGEFIDLYIGNLRSIMTEIMLLLAAAAAVTAITATGDDDRRNNGLKKYMTRALKKYYNEFAFYFNPIEFTRLLKNPVPVVGIAEDFYKFNESLVQEVYGTVIGDEELTEKSMPMKQFLKSVPVGKEYLLIHAAADEEFRKEWNIRVDNYFYR